MAQHESKGFFLLMGLLSGVSSGLFGAGGGVLVVLFITLYLHQDQHIAQATAISITFVASIISFGIYYFHGNIDWQLIIPVTLGSMVGGYLGAKLMKKLPSKQLKKFFGIFMILSGIRMMF